MNWLNDASSPPIGSAVQSLIVAPMNGGGEMGRRVRETDWSASALGAYETWPQSLRSSLSLVLNTKGIAALYWGPEQWLLYNDAYAAALGDRHPAAFGRPMPEVLTDIAPVLSPQVAEVLRTGEGFAVENLTMIMHRYGRDEETVWTYSFSPVQGEEADFAGVLLLATEMTGQKSVERLQAQSQLRLETALRIARLGIFDWQPYAGRIEMDARSSEIFGLPNLGEFSHENAFACIAPDHLDQLRTETLGLMGISRPFDPKDLGRTVDFNYDLVQPDGSRRSILSSGVIIQNPDGTRRMVGAFHDVTDLKRAEAVALGERDEAQDRETTALADAERVKLALAAGAIIGTWHWNPTTDQFTIDEAFATAFGLDAALGREGIPMAQIVATVHPDDQAGLAIAISEAVQRGGAYAHQYRTKRLDGNYYWLEANGRVEMDSEGTPVSFPGVLIDIEERRTMEAERDRATAMLQESEHFLRSVLASSNDCIKVLDIDAKLVFMSEGGKRVMEVSDFNEIVGCPWPDFWQEEGNLAVKEAIASAQAGVASTFQGYADTMKGNRRYWDVQVSPILGVDGKPERILSVSRDITALKEAEEVRAVLAQELAHRMKNTLAMVQAIVTQTLRQVPSIEEGRKSISHRLGALARAQDILTQSSSDEADARAVVEAAIGPHQTEDRRIHVNGQMCLLTAQQALGLSLAIHELSTNAAKYGALSKAAGQIDVSWKESNGGFKFTWIETGGPTVVPPETRGFGSKLIERIVASYFDGEGRIDFDPAGIQFTLTGALGRSELAA
ncbi:PAS domain-containing protein [Aureimonas sp. AU20]|uniref:PAS domain-containing sensor histidine kinase n=1 Tax=Aureimonas sp. AU20 TaxID=1349819 RepID=UPI0007209F6B|nr:PAS domain-containing protein [Aureimonas sp. AU20]ALN75832.1 hypothetical protein M673_24065 [Aureimonas sp. AU20]